MTRHLVKLVWSRRWANGLLILEIFVSFLVVFAVSTAGLIFLERVRVPLGFSPDNLYTLSIDERQVDPDAVVQRQAERTERLLQELRALPAVQAATLIDLGPFELVYSDQVIAYQGKEVTGGVNIAGDEALDTLGLELISGRWFDRSDDALDWTPVVINRRMAEELFGEEDPLGKTVRDEPQWRVVGVIEEFRKNGSLSSLQPYVICRASLVPGSSRVPRRLLLRVVTGTTADFEERALATVRGLEPEWTFAIEATDSIRQRNFRLAFAPLVVGVLVAGFLLVMVVLGLLGVFWQAVTQRNGELGLRRAVGGNRGHLYRQLLAEIFIVTSIGSLLAAVLVLQLPLLGLLGDIGWPTVLTSLLTSAALMYSLTTCSGLYPAWLAARIQPAAALHDE